MRNKKESINYKNYLTWLIIGLMFISFIFIFIYLGEINESKLNWLVATNGKKWGLLKDGSYGFGINDGSILINGFIFLITGGVLIIAILSATILILLEYIKFSSLSFIISSWFIFFSIVITGLIYPNKNEFPWQIIVRILLVIISYPISFFPFNFIIKKIFINTKYGENYIANLISNERENAKYINEINKISKNKNKNEKNIIEIEKDKI